LRILQLIQILAVNAEMLAEPMVPCAGGPRVNPREAVAGHEKGGVRIAEAASQAGNTEVLASSRFTAR
jgi:hypothetical protein